MSIATCGHEVDEGITCTVDEGQIMSDGSPALTYGTYCATCIEQYYRGGRLENSELNKLLRHTDWAYERMKYFKQRYVDLRNGNN